MPIFDGPPTAVHTGTTIFDPAIFDTLFPPANPRIEDGKVKFHPTDGKVKFHSTEGSIKTGR